MSAKHKASKPNESGIKTTKLWKRFHKAVKKEGLGADFESAVEEVCNKGITYSRVIVKTFPQFTLHDIVHITNVCNWMSKLLGDSLRKASARELALY